MILRYKIRISEGNSNFSSGEVQTPTPKTVRKNKYTMKQLSSISIAESVCRSVHPYLLSLQVSCLPESGHMQLSKP